VISIEPGQVMLKAQDRVDDDGHEHREAQKTERILAPAHIVPRVDPADEIDASLDWAEDNVGECVLSGEDVGHVGARRPHQGTDDEHEDDVEKQRRGGH
jgi:hypothetical protein